MARRFQTSYELLRYYSSFLAVCHVFPLVGFTIREYLLLMKARVRDLHGTDHDFGFVPGRISLVDGALYYRGKVRCQC